MLLLSLWRWVDGRHALSGDLVHGVTAEPAGKVWGSSHRRPEESP